MALYVLFETALGYGLFEVAEAEEIGQQIETVQVMFWHPLFPPCQPWFSRRHPENVPPPKTRVLLPLLTALQASILDLAKFGKICKLKSFIPFR
jgi:hypothetical protein